jgi:hypothetical protein
MARSPRRLAAPFLITLSALPACGGPEYSNPPHYRELTPPPDGGEPTAAMPSAVPAAPVATTAPASTTAPIATSAPTATAVEVPPLPEPNAAAHHYKNPDGTCWETSMGRPPKPCPPDKKCPPQPTFNPPPPHQVKCQ